METGKRWAGLSGLGIAIIVFILTAWLVRDDMSWPMWGGILIGVACITLGIVGNSGAVARYISMYWLALLFVFAAVLAIFLPEAWVEVIRMSERVPVWLARFLILLVLCGVSVLVFLAVREKGSFEADRAAAAANVTFLLIVGFGLLVTVNVIGANWATGAIGTIDTTETKVYSLGDRTKGLLAELENLDAPVYATYLDFGSNIRGRPGMEPLGARGKDFLQQYADTSPNLVVKVIDAIRDKTEADTHLRELGIMEMDIDFEDTVIFTYLPPGEDEPNRRDVVVNSWNFMETTQLATVKFKGEQLYTSAIQDVIYPRKRVYFLTGHGEYKTQGGGQPQTLAQAADLVRKLALDVETIDLAQRGRVPPDAKLVVIAGPQAGLAPGEVKALTIYLDNGGSLLLLVDPQSQLLNLGAQRIDLGIEDYLLGMGIDLKTGYQLMEYEVAVGSSVEASLPTDRITTGDYGNQKIVRGLSRRGLPVRFGRSAPVMVEMPEDAEGLTTEALVYVRRAPPNRPYLQSYGAMLYPNRQPLKEDQRADLRGKRLSVAVAAERKLTPEADEPDADGGRMTRVVVVGDADFATTFGLDTRHPLYAPGNPTLFANAVSWAVGREALISIEPKTLETETVALSVEETRLAKIIGIVALPIYVLAFAIAVAWRRRR